MWCAIGKNNSGKSGTLRERASHPVAQRSEESPRLVAPLLHLHAFDDALRAARHLAHRVDALGQLEHQGPDIDDEAKR